MMRDTTPRPAGEHPRTLFTLALAALLALGLSAGQAAAHTIDPCRTIPIQDACSEAAGNVGYVTAREGQFWLGTTPFRFVGTNAYFMHDATSYEAPGGPHRAAEMMHVANDLGFTVVRMWGFMNADGSGNNNGTLDQRLLQPLPWVYSDDEPHENPWTHQVYDTSQNTNFRNQFAHLDYVLAEANAHNVRVIFTFGNNWKEYGGIQQYLKWCPRDVPPDQRKPIHFYTHQDCIDLYQGYISYVLDRQNSINGRIYRDDPTIFAWELMNEPRCQGCQFNEEALGSRPAGSPPRTVHEWMGDMATFIKGRGATQMVATGEEGFDCTWRSTWVALGYQDSGNIRLHPWMYDGSQGLCYGKNTRIPDIDFGSFHIWPESWRFKNGAASEASWIRDHILIAKAGQQVPGDESAWNGTWGVWGGLLAKPAVLGEFGSSRSNRATQYDGWLTAVASDEPGWPPGAHGDGALVWQIMCPLCKNHATSLEVIFPPVSNESTTLCTHAKQFNSAPCIPTQPYAEPEIRRRR